MDINKAIDSIASYEVLDTPSVRTKEDVNKMVSKYQSDLETIKNEFIQNKSILVKTLKQTTKTDLNYAKLKEDLEDLKYHYGVKKRELQNLIKYSGVSYNQDLVDQNIFLRVKHLKQFFFFGSGLSKQKLKAVHDVSFDIYKGECFGVVGESGCGKTTTGRSIIRLYDITSGSIYFKGHRISAGSRWNEKEIKYAKKRAKRVLEDLADSEKEEIMTVTDNIASDLENKEAIDAVHKKYQEYRHRVQQELHKVIQDQTAQIRQINYDNKHVNPDLMSKMQMIFQDPIDSLDPRMTVQDIIQEGLIIQHKRNHKKNIKSVADALDKVGLIPEYASRYPHEFSGGQRQRIGIARALIMNPEFLICDEPISALDVSIRAQIINLLNSLKEEYGLTILFIAHDLSVVKYFCDRIAVMYFGEIVELASSDELFKHPLHPYTKALLSAIPKPDPETEKKRKRITYNPQEAHDYSIEKPNLVEIKKGHFVLGNTEEIKKYRQELKKHHEK